MSFTANIWVQRRRIGPFCLLVNGAVGNRARGLTVSARELARFAHLYPNRGNWNGCQLLSAAFVDQATSVLETVGMASPNTTL
jgi:hypothetical protein